MSVVLNNLQSMCGGCLCYCNSFVSLKAPSFAIFEKVISDVLYKFTSLQVIKGDALPKQLCERCFEDLTVCNSFLDKYQRSQQIIHNILSQKEAPTKIKNAESLLNDIKQETIQNNETSENSSETYLKQSNPARNLNVNTDSHKKAFTVDAQKNKCELCDKIFQKISILRCHLLSHADKKPHTCSTCGTHYNERDRFRRHIMAKHFYGKSHKCNFCEKAFAKKEHWVIHLRTHTGEKPYKCSFCEKCFSQRTPWVIHERTHTGEEPFICDVCNKGFARKDSLRLHLMTHRQEKPYKCGFCDKRFSQKCHWVVHERMHTGETPYRCRFCKKGFSQKGHHTAHERIHLGEKPYTCDVCNKGYYHQSAWKEHLKKHSDENPYRCGFCNKAFVQKGHLILHERAHTGEKPYTCDVCKKSFGRKHSWKRHLSTHSEVKL